MRPAQSQSPGPLGLGRGVGPGGRPGLRPTPHMRYCGNWTKRWHSRPEFSCCQRGADKAPLSGLGWEAGTGSRWCLRTQRIVTCRPQDIPQELYRHMTPGSFIVPLALTGGSTGGGGQRAWKRLRVLPRPRELQMRSFWGSGPPGTRLHTWEGASSALEVAACVRLHHLDVTCQGTT